MRRISASSGEPIKLTPQRRARLKDWLVNQHLAALNGRYQTEQTWRVCLRMDRGDTNEKMWTPFKDAPSIELTVGAQWADTVYAQSIDLVFQTKPPLIARSRHKEFDLAADAVQDLIDYGIRSGLWGFKEAVKEGLLDMVQLGPAIGYVPWTRTVRKTDVAKIEARHPRIYAVPPEDFIIPVHTSKDVQQARWCTYRLWFSKEDINLKGRMERWDDIADANATSDDIGSVRGERLKSAGLYASNFDVKTPYQIADTFAYYDIDDDGIEEQIEVVWNMISGGIHKVMWQRWDCRPFEFQNFQDRAHVAYGRGVLEMAMPYEIAATSIENNKIWNMMIANTKIYSMPQVMANEVKEIYPGIIIPSDQGEVKVVDMGQVTGAPQAAESFLIGMGQQRVGVQELAALGRLGGRTPGITALSALQQVNRRFASSFENIRDWVAGLVVQCLLRYQERVRADDEDVIEDLHDILGADKAAALIGLFNNRRMELVDAMDVELTAASVSVNRESDRQNMILLSQAYEKYIGAMTQFAQYAANPPFPEAGDLAKRAAEAVTKFMHKILLTFDQLSDVKQYELSIDEIRPMQEHMQEQIGQMGGAINQGMGGLTAPPGPQGPAPVGTPMPTGALH